MLLFLFLRRCCRFGQRCGQRVKLVQLLLGQLTGKVRRQLGFEDFAQLVKIAQGQLLEVKVVGEQGLCVLDRDLVDETATTGTGPGTDQALGLEDAQGLPHRTFGNTKNSDHLGFVGQPVPLLQVAINDPGLDFFRDFYRAGFLGNHGSAFWLT